MTKVLLPDLLAAGSAPRCDGSLYGHGVLPVHLHVQQYDNLKRKFAKAGTALVLNNWH